MPTPYRGCPNIRIADEWIPYRNEVKRYLDLISTTYTGRTLFKFIGKRSWRTILIKPLFPPPYAQALTNGENEADGYQKGATVLVPALLPDGRPATLPDGRLIYTPTGETGTGRGTNVTVSYHPAMWRQMMVNLHQLLPGAGPGEVLYHELVHAMRMLHGKALRSGVPAQVFMDDFDEFCAITAANMYRSERGFKTLRLDHHGSSPMNPIMAQSTEFFSIHEATLKKWFATQKDFCTELAGSTAQFNPLRIAADDLGIPVTVSMTL